MKNLFAVLPLLLLGLGIYSGQAQQSSVGGGGSSSGGGVPTNAFAANITVASNTVAGIALGGVRLVHGLIATSYGVVSAASLSNANFAAVAGDVVEVGAGTVTLSNKLTVTSGVTIRGVGDATEIQGWIITGPQIVGTDNARVERLRITSMLATNSSVGGAAIGLNAGGGEAAATNFIMRYITATNWNYDALYVSHTNRYYITVEHCKFWSRWDAGAIFPCTQLNANSVVVGSALSTMVVRLSQFACINQTSGNVAGDAHAFWATGGSNYLEGCTFEISGTPTNAMTGTNNYALAFADISGRGYMRVVSSTMTAGGPNPHSVGNLPMGVVDLKASGSTWMGLTNSPGRFEVAGCNYDSTTSTGAIQILSLPSTNGQVFVDNTNTLIVFGCGQPLLVGYYTNTGVGNLPIAGVPGYLLVGGTEELYRSGGVWHLDDDIDGTSYTNTSVQPTNDSWGIVAGIGTLPVPSVRWDRYSTNSIQVPGNVTFLSPISFPVNLGSVAVQTNWVSGLLYTNTSAGDWHVRAMATWTTAAVNGDAEIDLRVGAQGATLTRIAGAGASTTVAVTLSQSYSNEIGGYVNAGQVFTFTNVSAGVNNVSSLVSGTGQRKQF